MGYERPAPAPVREPELAAKPSREQWAVVIRVGTYTLRDLEWALGTFLARSAKKDDLILSFFAGHRAPEIDPRGIR